MARRKRDTTSTPIESIKHDNKRTNIPTEELRDFVDDDEKAPEPILYPRDPSLDPQLVWKGKDEQDSDDLEVASVPIYIQEKIQPQAIIEDIQATAQGDSDQLDFFSDFNGIEFQDLIDFYQHEQNWTNRMILGDSLLVMNSLAEKERLKGQVQMIYIDPPYGIKFGSNWQISTRKRDVKDGKVEDVTRQPEQIKAFRDTWELGIHSYLSYLRDRLTVTRELLTESGSVFVQIGEENVHLVRCLMDEVFGSENSICQISVEKRGAQPDKFLPTVNDWILWYGKDKERTKYRQLFLEKGKDVDMTYPYVELPTGERRRISKSEKSSPSLLPTGTKHCTTDNLTSSHFYESPLFQWHDKTYTPGNRYWSTSITGLTRLGKAGRLADASKTIRMIRYLDDFPVVLLGNVWTDTRPSSFGENKIYVVQTAQKVIQRCLLMTTDPGDLVLDPTCGSGTTAYVAEEWGRRWITIDTSRVALALARTRLMEAKYPYYLLADSPEGAMKEAELANGLNRAVNTKTSGDIKKGFVYERVPHITLKSIANNPEIDDIHAKWQEHLEPLRAEINSLAGENWEEWEIPHLESTNHLPANESAKYQVAIEKWWELRRERQAEIDAAIARHSEGEILYDKPFEDKKRLRITGSLHCRKPLTASCFIK